MESNDLVKSIYIEKQCHMSQLCCLKILLASIAELLFLPSALLPAHGRNVINVYSQSNKKGSNIDIHCHCGV